MPQSRNDDDDDQPEQQRILLRRAHGQHVVELAFNRPHRLNALDVPLYNQTAATLRALSADHTTRLIILTATGTTRSFCSGMDLNAVATPQRAACAVRAARRFMHALMECRKIVVAIVFGRVVGIGVTMLFHCDFVYCDASTTFHTPFTQLAISPEFASSLTFPLFLGTHRSASLLLRGDVLDAASMSAAGVCDMLEDSPVFDVVLKRCLEWTRRADQSQWNAVLHAKTLIKSATTPLIQRALHTEFTQIERDLQQATTVNLLRTAARGRL